MKNTKNDMIRLLAGLVVERKIVRLDAHGARWRVRFNMRGAVAFRGAGAAGTAFRGGLVSDFTRLGIEHVDFEDHRGAPLGVFGTVPEGDELFARSCKIVLATRIETCETDPHEDDAHDAPDDAHDHSRG